MSGSRAYPRAAFDATSVRDDSGVSFSERFGQHGEFDPRDLNWLSHLGAGGSLFEGILKRFGVRSGLDLGISGGPSRFRGKLMEAS